MEEGRYLNGLKQQEVPVFEEGTCYVRDFTELHRVLRRHRRLLSVHRRVEELAELVGGIARDFHTLSATVLADAERRWGSARGSSPDEDCKSIQVVALHAAGESMTHAGQDYFDVLG